MRRLVSSSLKRSTVLCVKRAPVIVGEPLKPARIAGDLLVLDQRRCPPVHRAQRREIRRGDAKAFAEMPPEQRRDDPNRVEEPALSAESHSARQARACAQAVGVPR